MEERHQRDIQALHAKIDKLFIALPRPIVERPIRYITDEEEQQIQDGETDPYEEVTHMTYIQGGYNKGYNSYKPPHSISHTETTMWPIHMHIHLTLTTLFA